MVDLKKTHCWHDIYISDYLRMEFFLYIKLNWSLREIRKQTWSKQRNLIIANISSVNECHKIDTSSRPGEKNCCQRSIKDQEKDEKLFTTTGTTTRVRVSKWSTTYSSASKRSKCVSTQLMQSQKISPINCTGHPTEIRGCVLVPLTQ